MIRKSKELFERAVKVIPGGVNSPVRAFKSVGAEPLFISRGNGSKIWDADGNMYIDYLGSWGPMILGHANPEVIEAAKKALEGGLSFGTPTEIEVLMGEKICSAIPSIEMVRMVNSGTEAAMSAIRLARAYTGRAKLIKFEGCYHGHADSFLIKAGSGALTFGTPDSPGVTPGTAGDTVTAQFNDIGSVEKLFQENPDEISSLIIEPVAGNMGCIPPEEDFLLQLRKMCDRHGALLIFDEVMTGFRAGAGGAQGIYGVSPDLTALGKIIGGGMPVGAYGGKKEIMEMISPVGPVYQAGTLSGNPVAMACGYTTLDILTRDDNVYETINRRVENFREGIRQIIENHSYPATLNIVGSMFTIFFTKGPVFDFSSAKTSDTNLYSRFFNVLINEGIFFPPSQYEAGFISAAHTGGDIEKTLSGIEIAFRKIF